MITYSQLGTPQCGRLGNQLFQIAATLGIAHQNGLTAVFPPWTYAKYFAYPLPQGTLSNVQIYQYTSVFYEPIALPPGNWDLYGFFASEKFFDTVSANVRRQFQPAEPVEVYLNQKYGSLLAQQPCSLHVRRGDYLKLSWDFPAQPLAYYEYAIQHFPSNTLFLVFSDDIAWCRQHFTGAQFVFIEQEEDIIDLLLMSRCRNHIIANSTFSWWGAWLNPDPDKVVLCPARWYGPGVTGRPEYYTRDLYARGFQPLTIPGEQKWKTNLYYITAHPVYRTWSKIYGIMNKIYSFSTVKSLAKKIRP